MACIGMDYEERSYVLYKASPGELQRPNTGWQVMNIFSMQASFVVTKNACLFTNIRPTVQGIPPHYIYVSGDEGRSKLDCGDSRKHVQVDWAR
jgi:hypothetical protein